VLSTDAPDARFGDFSTPVAISPYFVLRDKGEGERRLEKTRNLASGASGSECVESCRAFGPPDPPTAGDAKSHGDPSTLDLARDGRSRPPSDVRPSLDSARGRDGPNAARKVRTDLLRFAPRPASPAARSLAPRLLRAEVAAP
jgi:hypothetical protein